MRQVTEDLPRQAHGGEGHRHRAGADGGIGAHLLGHRKGMLEQTAQQAVHAAGLRGALVGAFHLTENLRFAEDHGIQAGGHAQDVAHRVGVLQVIEIGPQRTFIQVMKAAQPVDHGPALVLLAAHVQFGAVAGGEDGGLLDARQPGQLAQGLLHPLRGEHHAFAEFHRGSAMIDAERDQGHEGMRLEESTGNFEGCPGRIQAGSRWPRGA